VDRPELHRRRTGARLGRSRSARPLPARLAHRPGALYSGVSPGRRLAEVTVNEAAEMVTFAGRGGRRSSISLALAGAVLVRAA
jgi:hypothetical protein